MRVSPPSPRSRTTRSADRSAQHAIVVFGCAARADGTPTPGLLRRLQHALTQAQRDPQAVVIVSGGAVHNPMPEARAMANWLVANGLSRERIVEEPSARLTIENAELVVPLLRQLGVRRVTLTTERYHLVRSETLLKRALAAAQLSSVQVQTAGAPDERDFFQSLIASAREAAALKRDLVGQAELHRGIPLTDVPPTVIAK